MARNKAKDFRVRIGGKIVSYGRTPEEAVKKARAKGFSVPTDRTLPFDILKF